jgi:hypothetical protein
MPLPGLLFFPRTRSESDSYAARIPLLEYLILNHCPVRIAVLRLQIAGVQKVLGAAAWTYVAAAVSAIGSWLLYVFVLLSQRSVADRR